MKRVLLFALICAVSGATVAAERDSSEPVSAAQNFVTKATQDGLAEIELGKLAQSRSSDPKVKEFAATMVRDHTKANAELKAIAERKHFDVPTSLDDKHATMVHAVSTKPPSEFDGEYSRQMVDAHDTASTVFRDAEAVGDKDISAFAKKTLTTIHRHQQLAATLPSKRQAPAGTDPKTIPDPEVTPDPATRPSTAQ